MSDIDRQYEELLRLLVKVKENHETLHNLAEKLGVIRDGTDGNIETAE